MRTIKKIPESLKDACDRLGSAVFEVYDKPISGVYFLCEDGKVNYVGQSKDIKARIRTHRREKSKPFESVFGIKLPQEQLVRIEGMFITLLCPKYNMNGGHSLKAIDRAMEQEFRLKEKRADKKTVTNKYNDSIEQAVELV